MSPQSRVFFLPGENHLHDSLVFKVLPLSQWIPQYWGKHVAECHVDGSTVRLSRYDCEVCWCERCLQEMYEHTSLSRGKSLDPNPFGQGEYIEHKHSHLTCSNTLNSFPMLRVGWVCFCCLSHSDTDHVVPLIISLITLKRKKKISFSEI